jgi:SAM-dependent methyltransferase
MKHLRWPLAGFETVHFMAGATPRIKRTRYAVRNLRYWFARSALVDLHARLSRPLRVLEVGIDNGDMRCFVGGERPTGGCLALPAWIERWDGLDVKADPAVLTGYGYSDYIEADLEAMNSDWHRGRHYDAIIVLHVLEHLIAPERAMRHLTEALETGGILMGGSPTMPAVLASLHERHLRRKHAAMMHDVLVHRHLSVITPSRIRRFAREQDMQMEMLAGAFFLRASGNPCENSALWMRANLLWGALFPALGGEIYFSMSTQER